MNYNQDEKRIISWTKGKVALLILACLLLSFISGYGGTFLANKGFPSIISIEKEKTASKSEKENPSFHREDTDSESLSVQEIAAKNSESIVEIRTESVGQDPWLSQYVTEGAGSGIIIKSDGYIITNYHVIAGANSIFVSNKSEKPNSDREYTAVVAGVSRENDIAILKIDAKNLSAVTFGDSDKVQPGDPAVIIGNPLGELGDTVSAGVISAKDRKVTIEGQPMTLMQTDASVNPGNSGGGLFNHRGELIGVVVAKSAGSNIEGIGFAIPINVAAEISKDIIKGRKDSFSHKLFSF